MIQSKQLRKMIQQTFQQYATLKEDDCMIKFFETLKTFINYDEEVFPCELVVSYIAHLQKINKKSHKLYEMKTLAAINISVTNLSVLYQQGWSLSVELVIGGRGIRQRSQKDSAVREKLFLQFLRCLIPYI